MAQNRLSRDLEKVFVAKLERREFMRQLFLTAAITAASPYVGRYAWAQDAEALLPAGQVIRGKADALIVHNDSTGELETPLRLLRQHRLTPKNLMYIRNNQIREPEGRSNEGVPLDGWMIEIMGLVQYPIIFDAAELRDLEQSEVEMVLQCSGNGRTFFARTAETSGTQWEYGAMGNVRFRGPSLAAVLAEYDPVPDVSAIFLTAEGADEPGERASNPDFEHSVPLADVLDKAILALEMNGEPLPGSHGGPVRLVIPGYYGTMNMKWLTRLRFDAHETNNYNQIPRYRVPNVVLEPGSDFEYTFENSTPDWRQRVKSVIFSPLTGSNVAAGTVEVTGVAWNDGAVPITSVEISTDGGQVWQRAELETPKSTYAWHHFRANVELQSGEGRIHARATDALGRSQPLDGSVAWNPGGYEWSGVDHVDVSVA